MISVLGTGAGCNHVDCIVVYAGPVVGQACSLLSPGYPLVKQMKVSKNFLMHFCGNAQDKVILHRQLLKST